MDEVCTQFQCPFKEELFVCYRAIDFTPEIIYMLVYAVHCKCTQTKSSSSEGHIWFGKLLNKSTFSLDPALLYPLLGSPAGLPT